MEDKMIKCKIQISCKDENDVPKFLFGITSNDKCIENAFVFNKKQFTYCMDNSGCKWRSDIDKQLYACAIFRSEEYCNLSCKSGDIVTLILDLKNATISFEKNDVSLGVCHKDIVKKEAVNYKIAMHFVSLMTVPQSLSIKSHICKAIYLIDLGVLWFLLFFIFFFTIYSQRLPGLESF